MEKQRNATKTLAVIGLGYVGIPLALLADRKGFKVIGVDINKEKIELLKKRTAPFKDEKVAEGLKSCNVEFTTDFSKIKDVSNVVICVPTPVYESHMPDLRPVEGACNGIAPYLQAGQLVVLESTVNPGVCDDIVIPILERVSRLKAGKDFYVAHCPERINPGDKKWNVENIPRVVGSLEEAGLKRAVEFYSSIISSDIKQMGSLKEAEAVKIVENSFRDINIAFVNELACSFSKLGIDVVRVIEGAATKPFSFLAHFPGCGVGGHCIPVDPYYLIEYAKEHGFEHDFLSLARRINNHMPKFTAHLVMEGLNKKRTSINGAKVTVLGIAYKADIDDFRESPSFEIIKCLKELGAEVVGYDPHVPSKSDAVSLDEAIKDSQAVVLATAHTEFKEKITPEFLSKHGVKVIVDGRNCLIKEKFIEAGIVYKGIGR